MMARYGLLVVLTLGVTANVRAADANAGRYLFRQECTLCHTAEAGDDGGGQGPSLAGVLGRRAASAPGFGYTAALRASGFTWDAPTLVHFLSSPTTVVPGTAMVIAVPKSEDRDNLIAYFQGLKDGTLPPTKTPRKWLTGGPPPNPESAAESKLAGDWRNDVPGRAHRIDVARLPAPYATASARNAPRVIDKPPGARLSVPEGFSVSVFSRGVLAPRAMRLAPNGDIFLTETNTGRVKVLRPSADGTAAASVEVFAKGLNLPFGMAFYPSGSNPRWLYIAESTRLVRYAYKVGQQHASGVPEVVVPQFYPNAGTDHITRDVVFSPDGKRLFVGVGSSSNVAEQMPKKSAQDIVAWQSKQGLGAAWGADTDRADVLVFDVDDAGKLSPAKIFATGLRNCAGLALQPATGVLWCTVNERDGLGDDLVPDYSTRVKEGGFYGWPWYYLGDHEDPRKQSERPDLRGKVTVADVPYQAHSAPLNMLFYTATTGSSAFPSEYLGDGFVAFHGSWNRSIRTGYKIVRVRMHDGVPTGEYDDFLVGFIVDNSDVWGRPVGLVTAADGSLLFSDDGNNVIYRIAHSAY
jgi:glucose/arabinose dehydrogenase/cytochrome c2